MDPQLPPKPQPLPPPEPGRPTANDPLAVTSLALGATSLFFTSLVVGPLAIIFGIIALTRIASSGQQGKGLAVAGIVTGILGPVLVVSLSLLDVLGGAGTTYLSGLFE